MKLTRREFAAAAAGGLSPLLFPRPARAANPVAHLGAIRYAHLELPAGPYPRREIAQLASEAASSLGFPAPAEITVLGPKIAAEHYPETFALTCIYPDGKRLAIRATPSHTGAPELTVRGQRNSLDLRYIGGTFQPCHSERSEESLLREGSGSEF